LSLTGAALEPVSLPDPSLARWLAAVPDPCHRRGVRHSLMSLLMASVAAVLADDRQIGFECLIMPDMRPGQATVSRRACSGHGCSVP